MLSPSVIVRVLKSRTCVYVDIAGLNRHTKESFGHSS